MSTENKEYINKIIYSIMDTHCLFDENQRNLVLNLLKNTKGFKEINKKLKDQELTDTNIYMISRLPFIKDEKDMMKDLKKDVKKIGKKMIDIINEWTTVISIVRK